MNKNLYIKIGSLLLLIFLVFIVILNGKFMVSGSSTINNTVQDKKYLIGTQIKWRGLLKPVIKEIYFTKKFDESLQQDFNNHFICYISSDMSLGTILKDQVEKTKLQSYKNYHLKGNTLNVIVESDGSNITKFQEYNYLVIQYKIFVFSKKIYLTILK